MTLAFGAKGNDLTWAVIFKHFSAAFCYLEITAILQKAHSNQCTQANSKYNMHFVTIIKSKQGENRKHS